MRLLVQTRQAVCDGSGRLLVTLVLSTHLEPFVPRLRSAAAHQKQEGQGNLSAHDLYLFHFNVNVSAGAQPSYPHIKWLNLWICRHGILEPRTIAGLPDHAQILGSRGACFLQQSGST